MFKLGFFKKNAKKPATCPSGVYWEVGRGDSFYLISKKLNVPLDRLIAANPHVDPKNLQIGSRICIPQS